MIRLVIAVPSITIVSMFVVVMIVIVTVVMPAKIIYGKGIVNADGDWCQNRAHGRGFRR